ncbi:LysR family transcriptional regulator [Bacillus sp. NP157]|nr:LysR family transcriptional regulator [Bacillus sp. NP157]
MDSLNALATFVHAAETRNFTQAARRSGVTASTVAKIVVRLETELGVRLFHRSTRSISLTPEGEYLLERARRILQEVSDIEHSFSGDASAPRGKLRVTLPLLGGLFAPMLASFMIRYPGVELDLDYSDRLVDIIDEGFDLAIRTGDGGDSRLMTRRLGAYHLVLVAAPTYLERFGRPTSPGALKDHRCLHHRYPTTGKLEPWPMRVPVDDLPVTAAVSTLAPLLEMAESGAGIACLPDFLIASAVREGRLERVLDEYVLHENVFRAVWPSSRNMAPRLRAFIDHVAAHLFPAQA